MCACGIRSIILVTCISLHKSPQVPKGETQTHNNYPTRLAIDNTNLSIFVGEQRAAFPEVKHSRLVPLLGVCGWIEN